MSHNFQLPKFNHPEVEVLYEYDLSIPKEKIVTILALPRTTLITDLELILNDIIERQEYFVKTKEDDQWFEVHTHALWLLIELDAKEALPTILKLLQQSEDFGWNWFGDSLTEDYWQILYFLGDQSLEALKTFVLTLGYWANRTVATTAVKEIAQHQPEKRALVIEWFRSLIDNLLARAPDDPVLDEDVIGSIVVDLIQLKAVELLPLIKQLDERALIGYYISGDYDSIEQDITDSAYSTGKREVFASIFERYTDALSTWHGYRMKYDEAYKKERTYKPSQSVAPPLEPSQSIALSPEPSQFVAPLPEATFKRIGKKVGRNAPCPCGSGKKYKRCCLKK